MIFRVSNNFLYEIDIDVENEDEFVKTQSNEYVKYVSLSEEALPTNPYENYKAYYKYDENGDIALDETRMLEDIKSMTVVNINSFRDMAIEQGFLWQREEEVDNGDGTTSTVTAEYLISLKQIDINGLLSLAMSTLLGKTEGLFFITQDNKLIDNMSVEEVQTLARSAEDTLAYIIRSAREYKDAVLAASTLDELMYIIEQMNEQASADEES